MFLLCVKLQFTDNQFLCCLCGSPGASLCQTLQGHTQQHHRDSHLGQPCAGGSQLPAVPRDNSSISDGGHPHTATICLCSGVHCHSHWQENVSMWHTSRHCDTCKQCLAGLWWMHSVKNLYIAHLYNILWTGVCLQLRLSHCSYIMILHGISASLYFIGYCLILT